MSPQHRRISGWQCVKILCNEFGFSIVRQHGSHIVLRKETVAGAVGTVVPDHSELKPGTLKGVLRLARVNEEKFWEKV